MSDTIEISWEGGRGRTETRKVRQTLDVRSFVGVPGYALLVIAANLDLSGTEIVRFLAEQGVKRPEGWVAKRRRWLFQPPGTVNPRGNRPNKDGNDARAFEIMARSPKASPKALVAALKAEGISRSANWVREHRLDGVG